MEESSRNARGQYHIRGGADGRGDRNFPKVPGLPQIADLDAARFGQQNILEESAPVPNAHTQRAGTQAD